MLSPNSCIAASNPSTSGRLRRGWLGALAAVAVAASLVYPVPAGATAQQLTDAFSNVPATHDGSAFTFNVTFAPEPDLSYGTLRDHAFTVVNGSVTKAARVQKSPPRNLEWIVHVQPDLDEDDNPVGDISITLPATTTSCSHQAAICTSGNLPLSNSTQATISAPTTIVPSTVTTVPSTVTTVPSTVTTTRTSTVPADTTPVDTTSQGNGSGGTSSNEDSTGEDSTGDASDDDTAADDGTAAALAARTAEAGRIKDLGDVTDTRFRRFRPTSTQQRSAGESRFFRFEVTEQVLARVGLRALKGDVDLHLEDAAGRTLGSSVNAGTANEDVEVVLDSGEYFIRVITRRDWRVRFNLRYEMDEPPPPSLPVGSLHPVLRSALRAQQDPSKKVGQSQVGLRQSTDDCANGTSTTCTITIGTAKSGSIEAGGDEDWYRVTLVGSRLYDVTIDGGTGSGALGDTARLRLRHSLGGTFEPLNGVVLPMWASRGSTDPADLVFYIVVRSTSSTATGAYTVTVSERPDDCRADSTDTTADPACTTTRSGSVDTGSYHIERPGDIDWIKTPELTAGTRYGLDFSLLSQRSTALGATVILGIYKSDGSRIAFTEGKPRWSAVARRQEFYAKEGNSMYEWCRDNFRQVPPGEICGPDASDIVHFSPPADGHYFVAVTGRYGVTGWYELNLRSVGDIVSPYRAGSGFAYPDGRGDSPASLPSGPSGTAAAGPSGVNDTSGFGGYMQRDAQRNWHAITLTRGRAYEITVTPRTVIDSGTGETVHEGVLNPRLVGIADGSGNEHPPGFHGLNSVGTFGDRQSFAPPTTGTYYIVVEGGPFDWDSKAPFEVRYDWGAQIRERVTTGEYLIEVRRTG